MHRWYFQKLLIYIKNILHMETDEIMEHGIYETGLPF